MKDNKGYYYYPFPKNRKIRMYVKRDQSVVCFRLWNEDDPQMWMEHGWVPYEAIQQASAMFTSGPFDPEEAYDLNIAMALLNENKTG